MTILKPMMKVFFIALLICLNACKNQSNSKKLTDDGLYAEIVTNKGAMTLKLHYDKVPVTVANFVALAEGTHPNVKEEFKGKPFYDNTIFHRVINNFMIQGGDPTATGSGSPGYRFQDEFHPDLKHDKPGILSMANSGPATNGSQFFITEAPTPHLDNRHAVFGEVVDGLAILDSISNVKTLQPGVKDKPEQDVVISKINIIRKGKAAKAFEAAKVYTEELPKITERQRVIKEEKLKALKEKTKVAAQKFIKDNANLNARVYESKTGLVMLFVKEPNGLKPKSEDSVLIDYSGYLENGQLFDTSSEEIAKKHNKYSERRAKEIGYKPFPMQYNEKASLVPGFKEAMLNMKVGDKAHVFIPSFLGYGERNYGPIPANSNLIFDLEIVGLKK